MKGTACIRFVSGPLGTGPIPKWYWSINGLEYKYNFNYCYGGKAGITGPTDSQIASATYCTAAADMQLDANNEPVYSSFISSNCEGLGLQAGLNELSGAFNDAFLEILDELENIPLPFNCGEFDNEAAVVNFFTSMPELSGLLASVSQSAFQVIGYDPNNPGPTHGMLAERAACLAPLPYDICAHFQPPGSGCAVCGN